TVYYRRLPQVLELSHTLDEDVSHYGDIHFFPPAHITQSTYAPASSRSSGPRQAMPNAPTNAKWALRLPRRWARFGVHASFQNVGDSRGRNSLFLFLALLSMSAWIADAPGLMSKLLRR